MKTHAYEPMGNMGTCQHKEPVIEGYEAICCETEDAEIHKPPFGYKLANLRRKPETPASSEPDASVEGKLTPEQVGNWRHVLLPMLGSYALIMPVREVQAYRDKMQEHADALAALEPKE